MRSQGVFWNLLGQALQDADSLEPTLWGLVSQVLELESIEETLAVKTASIYFTSHGEVGLAVNPLFVEAYVKEPRDALFIFLHELSHQERRELLDVATLGRSAYERFIYNVASDMLINRRLERSFFPQGVGLLDRLYPPDSFPGVLLASPVSLERRLGPLTFENLKGFFQGFEGVNAHLASQCYLLSLNKSTSVYDLTRLLKRLIPRKERILFVGSHELEDLLRECPGYVLKDAFKILRRHLYSRRKLKERQYRLEASFPFFHHGEARKLIQAIAQAITDVGKPYRHKRASYPERTVVPTTSRREVFLMAGGCLPVFYETKRMGHGLREEGVHLYLDVSGSLTETLPFIYGLLRAIGDELASDRVYLFSTRVKEITIEELYRGKVSTSLGTDYDCVVDHARENQAQRILVITDGYGNVSRKNLDWIKRAGVSLFLVLVGRVSYYSRIGLDTGNTPLISVAKKVWGLRMPRKN